VAAILALAGGLAACAPASDAASSPAAPALRLIVRFKVAPADAGAAQRQVRQMAGVPVVTVSAVSEDTYAVGLACAPAAQCDEAMQRLQHDDGVRSVVVDRPMRTQSPARRF
jgi:hypothetical protein